MTEPPRALAAGGSIKSPAEKQDFKYFAAQHGAICCKGVLTEMFKKSDPIGDAIKNGRLKVDAVSKFSAKRSATIAARDAALQAAADVALGADERGAGEAARLTAECDAHVRTWPLLVKGCVEAIRLIPTVAARVERGTAEAKQAEAKKTEEAADPVLERLGQILEIDCDRRMTYFSPNGPWFKLSNLAPADENDTISSMMPDPSNGLRFSVPKPARLRAEAEAHLAKAAEFERFTNTLVIRAPKTVIEAKDHMLHESPISIFASVQATAEPAPKLEADVSVDDLEALLRQALAGVGRTISTAA